MHRDRVERLEGVGCTGDEAVRLCGLTKVYRGRVVLDGLELSIAAGEIVGLLGDNGAGKTTAIRLLLGLARPSAGRAFAFGEAMPSRSALARTGALLEAPAFYRWRSGRANLAIIADQGPPVSPSAVSDALDLVGLTAQAGQSVRTYSQGMRQRLGLAAALMRHPRLLVLDEPANGLDPTWIARLRDLVRHEAAAGAAVLVSSHLLGEVEQVCDRVAVLDHGKLLAVGPTADIGGADTHVRVVVRTQDHAAALGALRAFVATSSEPGVLLVAGESGRTVNAALAAAGVIPDQVGVERLGLEARLLRLTTPDRKIHDLTEEAGP